MEEGKEGRDWEENDENDAAERPAACLASRATMTMITTAMTK